MAKRKFYTRRYYVRSRRSYSRHSGSGGLLGLLSPVIAGVADGYLNNILPIKGVGATGVGFLLRNNTLQQLGMYQVGGSLMGLMGFGGSSLGGGY